MFLGNPIDGYPPSSSDEKGGGFGDDHHDNANLEIGSRFLSSSYASPLTILSALDSRRPPPTTTATTNTTTTTTTRSTIVPMDSKWTCVSPMTHHVINRRGEPLSPGRLRRRRSRSFNDYIDSRHPQGELRTYSTRSPKLMLPSLGEGKGILPPKRPVALEPPTPPPPRATRSSSGEYGTLEAATSPLQQNDLRGLPGDEQYPSANPSGTNDDGDGDDDTSIPLYISAMYGCINATIVIPVVMSFGSIIYQDPAFRPYSPVLIKLTLVSGVVHQLCFSSLSSLPFAVGSVQDAGLIFLSSMASDMVQYCQTRGYDDETMLATVTVGLGVAAAVLGVGLIIVGQLKLAGYVQLLPTCVVAGYLAFIGFFCGKSGIGLMANVVLSSTGDARGDTVEADSNDGGALTWQMLLENWIFVVPGILGGVFIYGCVRTFRHVAVLPTCIVILLVCFYAVLAMTGSSIEEATEHGWIRQAEPAPVWYRTWDYLKLDKVVWSALPQLLLTELSMLFVVALSSSLDVAAIELEMKSPLNYNQELTVVGISNVVSGLTGGYTGSYIFSQSIFSLRCGIRSRVAGFVLALCQTVIIVTPIPILSYVPNFFYGSLLGMICIDLLWEWLWDFRTKVQPVEYGIGLSTFVLIQALGVEYGILAGVGIYLLCRYANLNVGELKIATEDDDDDDDNDDDKGHHTTQEPNPPSHQLLPVSEASALLIPKKDHHHHR